MRKYEQLAKDIIKNVGGKENIKELKHCITRLRFSLKDEGKAQDEVLKNMDGVISVVKAMGQYMVVIGEHVTEVYDEVMLQLGNFAVAEKSDSKEKGSLVDKFLGVIMAGMGPCLNLLCACGIIKGLTTIVAMFGLPTDSGIYMLLNAAGDCIFYSLPLMLGYNVAKKYEIDPFFGFLLGAALTYPTIQNVDLNFFGYVVNTSYTSSFLPVLFGLLFGIPLYKFLHKHIHPLLRGFFTPLLTLLIAFPVTFLLIGPLANMVGTGINFVLNSLFALSPVIGGLVMGGLWQILVMFGVHGIPTMFAFYDLIAGNPSLILGITGIVCYAVSGTLLAVALKSKNTELKSQSGSALVSSVLGITEPAMYGVIIPRKQILLTTCLGGAAGGLLVGLFNMKAYTYAGIGIIGMLGYLNPAGGTNILGLILIVAVPFAVSFISGMAVFKDQGAAEKKTAENKEATLAVKSPADGLIKAMKDCSDPVFSAETLGKGCVILPENGNIYAPVSGTVTTVFPTKHAIGILGENGVEVLLHVGINTVNLDGKGFHMNVKQNDQVKEGQLLMTFDKDAIEKAGFSTEIPVIVTNSSDYLDVVEVEFKQYQHGETILAVVK